MIDALGYCLCFVIGAGSVIFSFKTFSSKDRPVSPKTISVASNQILDDSEAKIIEQWQELLDYDPYRPKEPQPEGGEMNERD